MRFGIFYEHQLPKPCQTAGRRGEAVFQALDQDVLADKLGYDYGGSRAPLAAKTIVPVWRRRVAPFCDGRTKTGGGLPRDPPGDPHLQPVRLVGANR